MCNTTFNKQIGLKRKAHNSFQLSAAFFFPVKEYPYYESNLDRLVESEKHVNK